MKRTITISSIAALIAAFVFISCHKKPDDVQPEPSYHLNVSVTAVQSGPTASSTDVSIDANAEWKITIPAGTDWLEVSKASGTGNDNIQVKVTKENNTGTKRTAVITVALVNGKAAAKQINV